MSKASGFDDVMKAAGKLGFKPVPIQEGMKVLSGISRETVIEVAKENYAAGKAEGRRLERKAFRRFIGLNDWSYERLDEWLAARSKRGKVRK